MVIQWLYMTYLQIPYWKDSVTLWKHAASLEPSSKFVDRNFGKALIGAGRFEEALLHLEKSKGDVMDYANLGFLFAKRNKLQEAENIILEGLQKFPDQPALINKLGELKLVQKKYKEALVLFTKALENLKNKINPKLRSLILNNLGLATMQLGNYDVAESYFRQALALINNDDVIIHNLRLVLVKQGRLGEANESN